jgi:hypothetical protein
VETTSPTNTKTTRDARGEAAFCKSRLPESDPGYQHGLQSIPNYMKQLFSPLMLTNWAGTKQQAMAPKA